MTSKNDNSTWLNESRRRKQEAAEADRARIDALLAERAAIDAQLAALGYTDVSRTMPRPAYDKDDRRLRSCSICLAAGLTDDAKGHVARGHDRWLGKQPAHIQAHFKGQPTPSDLEPRLVKP